MPAQTLLTTKGTTVHEGEAFLLVFVDFRVLRG
jgi:hypothetical protein